MGETKHTPGPWIVRQHGYRDVRIEPIANGDYITIASMGNWTPEYQEEADANARLIAAAPELLTALKRLLAANDADFQHIPTAQIQFAYQTNGEALRAAREAIAKAKGREL